MPAFLLSLGPMLLKNWKLFAIGGGLGLLAILLLFARADARHWKKVATESEAALKAERQARATEANGAAIAGTVRAANDTEQAAIRTVTQTIVKEVPRYVSSTIPCQAAVPGQPDRVALADVSVGFGLLHDAAATGNPPLPAAAGVDLDAARGTGMPAVAATIVTNYGLCHGWRAEARSWRDWYARQSAAWPVK